MNIKLFKVEEGKIGLNKYKISLRHYTSLEKEDYTDEEIYLDDAGLYEYEVNFVPKHRLLEIVEKTELDTSEYAWMEGIELKTDNRAQEIAEIAAYGSLEAYQASLPESQDAFNLDIDYRLSKIELGI